MSYNKKCQDKIVEITGKKQVSSKIEGTSYAFLCNLGDLRLALKRMMLQYKIKDYEKIEKIINNIK